MVKETIMKTNSKKIGNMFEREVAKLLSLKVSNNERTDLFCRTPGSGNTFKDGDIMLATNEANYKWFDFIIECKTSKTGSILPLRSSVKEYLRQCVKRYKNKRWLLIVKFRNNDGAIYCIAPDNSAIHLDKDAIIMYFIFNEKTFFVFDFFKLKFYQKI